MFRTLGRKTLNASQPNTTRRTVSRLGLAGTLAAGALLTAQLAAIQPSTAQQTGPVYTFFPTASTTDGRMIGLSGRPAVTLAGETIDLRLAVPSGATSFEIGLFDGDTGKDNAGNLNAAAGNWDSGPAQLIYTLYADPTSDLTGGTIVAQWTGNDANPVSGANYTASSATMPNNDWWSALVRTTANALSPDGSNYIYRLEVRLSNMNSPTSSNFKLRTTASLGLAPQSFSSIPVAYTDSDYRIVYPTYDGSNMQAFPFQSSPTTYDGTFTYFLRVPAGLTELEIWDGDFDHGSHASLVAPDGVPNSGDTDDANTPNAVPAFAAGTDAQAEGAQGQGSPPDDHFRDWLRRSPAVRYEVVAPNGQVFANENPSGNREWERFLISTSAAANSAVADHVVAGTTIQEGVWTVRLSGLDLDNLIFLRFPVFALGQDTGGAPPAEVTAGTVSGCGSIRVATTKRRPKFATFNFTATCTADGACRGKVSYYDPETGQRIRSNRITRLVVNGSHATVYGITTVRGVDQEFQIDVDDLGRRGRNDRFQVKVGDFYQQDAVTLRNGDVSVRPAQ